MNQLCWQPGLLRTANDLHRSMGSVDVLLLFVRIAARGIKKKKKKYRSRTGIETKVLKLENYWKIKIVSKNTQPYPVSSVSLALRIGPLRIGPLRRLLPTSVRKLLHGLVHFAKRGKLRELTLKLIVSMEMFRWCQQRPPQQHHLAQNVDQRVFPQEKRSPTVCWLTPMRPLY